jgi:hypothetical protein
MSDPAKQNFPSDNVKVLIAAHAESHAAYGDKSENQQSAQVLSIDCQQLSLEKHHVNILFTNFTRLITIQISPPQHRQRIFIEQTLRA